MIDDDGIARRPKGGRRRVSMLVAVPVVVGCAALGTVAGVLHPMRSFAPAADPEARRADARAQGSTRPAAIPVRSVTAEPAGAVAAVPSPPRTAGVAPVATPAPPAVSPPPSSQKPPIERPASSAEATTPAPVAPLRTGSVDRGTREGQDAAAAEPPRATAASPAAALPQEAEAPQPAARPRRQARAKRVRRTYAKPAQSEPNPSAAFFSSLFGPQPK